MDIVYIVLGITSVSFLIAYIRTAKKLGAVSAGLAELYLSYTVLMQAKVSDTNNDEVVDTVHKESFIKFLSDSRDWAFTYIEDVQAGLKGFIENVEPYIEHYETYGVVAEGMMPPYDNALKKISKEFKELKKLLPEEAND